MATSTRKTTSSSKSSTQSSKKTSVSKVKSKPSLLQRTKREATPIRMLCCGKPKTGKTMFAGSAPMPVFIDTDSGMISVPDDVPYFKFERISKDAEKNPNALYGFNHVMDILSDLYTEDGPYWDALEEQGYVPETIVLDSLSALCDLLEAEVVMHPPDGKESIGLMRIQDYNAINLRIMEILMFMRNLPYNVIVTAGIEYSKDEFSSILEQPMATGQKLGAKVGHVFDEVYRHFYDEKTEMWYLTPQQSKKFEHPGSRYLKLAMKNYPNPTWNSIVKKKGK